jgi:hypothetical protein
MSRLEEHIRKNREDLDRYSPSPDVWNKISRDVRKKKSLFTPLRAIAAVLVIAVGLSSVILLQKKNSKINMNEGFENTVTSSDGTQLKETEIYYNNLVNSLYSEAQPLLTGYPEMETELTSDFSHLDSIFTDIKKDLKDNADNQEVVEALIQNYRIKIRILEEMVTILKENSGKKEKNANHEL